MPSQAPSSPQVDAACIVHCSSGSWPAGTAVQLPRAVDSAQDRQVPVQSDEQQTPWEQNVELHSVPLPQLPPSGFFPQLPPMQVLGAMQSASVVQVVRHWPLAPQT